MWQTGFNAAALVGVSETFFTDKEEERMESLSANLRALPPEAVQKIIDTLVSTNQLTQHQLERARTVSETTGVSLLEAVATVSVLTPKEALQYKVDEDGTSQNRMYADGVATFDQVWNALYLDQQNCILTGYWPSTSNVLTRITAVQSHDLARTISLALGITVDFLDQ